MRSDGTGDPPRQLATVNIDGMSYLDPESGHRGIVIRREIGPGLALPLTVVELEAAVSSGARVCVRGKGPGKVLFVMDDNAKVRAFFL